MSPILVRPVREQLEHDRIIRLLQARWRRKYEAAINIGDEKVAFLKVGASTIYPDLVLYEPERGKRLEGVVEVETGESVNHLEALAQWTYLSKARVPFFLFVPANMVDVARRLCANHHVTASEIWSYHTVGDEIRFTLVHRAPVERKAVPRKAESLGRDPRKAQARKPAVPPAGRKATGRTPSARKTRVVKSARKPAARTGGHASRSRSISAVRRKTAPRAATKPSAGAKSRAKRK